VIDTQGESIRVPLRTKTAFGIGQIAEGVKNTSFNLFLFFFYNQVLGLSGTLTGLALFIATAFDAITDPMAGSISDRTRHRWGRRHPYMYASALPLGITFALLFSPPAGLTEWGTFGWLVAFTVLVRGSMTLYHVPHMALGAELSADYDERTSIAAFRTAFGLLGAAAAVGVAWLVLFAPTPEFERGQLDPSAYPLFGLTFGCVIVVTILASALGTHDRISSLPQPPPGAPPFRFSALASDYAGALANEAFQPFFIGIVIFFVMRGIQEVLAIHMSTYFWALDQQQIATVALATLPGFVAGVPLWAAIGKRGDKRPTFLWGIGIFSVMVLGPPIAKLAGFFPVAESGIYVPLLALASFLAAFGASAGLVMAGSMMADIADEHELHTGSRNEGVFFGALSFAAKSTSGLGSFIAGLGIDFIDFPTRADPAAVPEAKILSLGVLYGPGIAVLAVAAIAVLSRYPIDRARHARTTAALARSEDDAADHP
jgi:Na+/melibiose symporter-like transporter